MRFFKTLAFVSIMFFTSGLLFGQDSKKIEEEGFKIFDEIGVNLKYSKTSKRKFSFTEVKAIWKAQITDIQILGNSGNPIFPAAANTYFTFEKPVEFNAEVTISILKAIFNKDPSVKDAKTIAASIKSYMTSDGVRKFIDNCYAEPSKSAVALAAKAALLALDAIDAYNGKTRLYTIKVDLAVQRDQITVTESVYDDDDDGTGLPIFSNSNSFKKDMLLYLKKILELVVTK